MTLFNIPSLVKAMGGFPSVGSAISDPNAVSEKLAVDIRKAYALYDSDPRVNSTDDYEAFRDAIVKSM